MFQASFLPYQFDFNFPGGTSRGVLTQKPSFFIKIAFSNSPETYGLGEVSLIPGLSPEKPEEIEKLLNEFVVNPYEFFHSKDLSAFPALKFGIETAFLDLAKGGTRILYPSKFTQGLQGIAINGLIWMGDRDLMLQRLKEKVNQGFTCLKLKVGAIDFNEEENLLKYIRESFPSSELELRVDANGAFSLKDAKSKLEVLSKYAIHSIEQPIKQGQWHEMAELCKNTPIPIALDEELIGITDEKERIKLLETINPQYIILKPSLIGGLKETENWSNLAKAHNIGWWVTSALEGNIGLNAIAQWTFQNGSNMPQGLGTGQVFSNNIDSPLEIRGQQLWYNPEKEWNLGKINFDQYSTLQPSREIGTGTQGGESPNVTIVDKKLDKGTTDSFETLNTKEINQLSPEKTKNTQEVELDRLEFKIRLNSETYSLNDVGLNALRILNQNEAWWQDIIAFLADWANDSSAIILKTSGSTGEPKLLQVEKSKLWVSASKTCDFFSLNQSSNGLLCLSANYIAGKMMLVRAMVSGMNLICMEPSGNPVRDLKMAVDFAAMVPLQVEQAIKTPNKFSLIKGLIIGGGQVSSDLVNKIQSQTLYAYETFGMTETLSHIALKQLSPKYQNYFVPFNGVFILQGYNNVLVIDFPELGIYKMKTNDIVEIVDNAGTFIWKGRTDFIINSGGIKISPEEIEFKIAQLFTQKFCIVGLPDEKLGEKVVLVIEGISFDTKSVMEEIAKLLPNYYIPKQLKFLKEFPLTPTGKIRRKEIINQFQK